jgi:hypothetical protein
MVHQNRHDWSYENRIPLKPKYMPFDPPNRPRNRDLPRNLQDDKNNNHRNHRTHSDPYTPAHMAVPPLQKGNLRPFWGFSLSVCHSRSHSPLRRRFGYHFPSPSPKVNDWVCVSEDLDIYICDTGLTHTECDALVQTAEQVCKGHYAAYTYAKQTLGCREFPVLAHACWEAVHRVTHSIWNALPKSQKLQLDDREPHIVKYDVTKKERQKLDMHTDKSEWTFLIALSDGCGLDYEGGGTFFEALNATVHVQRGHALIFPGKLRHCGQRITKGLRFLLVGFLVDKTTAKNAAAVAAAAAAADQTADA